MSIGAFTIIAKPGNCPNVHQEENGHLVYSDDGLLTQKFSISTDTHNMV